MLKIKDNVDLRKIKKYNLHDGYLYLLGRTIYFEIKDNYYIQQKMLDILYDLIKDDLVEKVKE